jgi:hypothetical protein
MKYYQVITTQKVGDTRIYYPFEQESVGYVHSFYYTDNETKQFVRLLAIPDVEAMAKADILNVEGVNELTEAEMFALIDTYEPVKEAISDEAKIKRIELKLRILELKLARGQTINAEDELTENEINALNPESSESGIVYTKTSKDIINDKKILESQIR